MASDSQQRIQALNINNSYIIQAPAGSGKTELLTQRYLKLLSISKYPENVIAITFTNKAVAELKARVIKYLELATSNIPQEEHKKTTYDLAKAVLQQDKKHNWQMLKNSNRIKILTIDALAASIVKNNPLENNFNTPNILNTSESLEIYTSAAKNTLLQIDDKEFNQSIKNLLIYTDNNSNKFIKLIVDMLKKRDKWVNQLFDNNKINFHSINHCITNIINHHITQLQQLATTNLNKRFFQLCLTNTKFYHLTKIPDNLNDWCDVAELCLTKTGTIRAKLDKNCGFTPELKQQKLEFKEIINNLTPKFIEKLQDIRMVPNVINDNNFLTNVVKVLFIANNELQDLFYKHNCIDFIEVMLNANKTLFADDEINDISMILDYKINHILIDEFQDTSYTQLSLIENITQHWQIDDAKTLFLVGDPMQSIYRFRGAEVGVFLYTRDYGISNIKLHNIVLTNNFRSTNNIVKSNNEIFNKIFPDFDDIDLGAIKYSTSTSQQLAQEYTALTVHPLAYKDDEKEANEVVNIIKNSTSDDIAILYYSRNHITTIIDKLNHNNIAFEAVNGSKMNNNLFTKDLLTLTNCLLDLGNKLSWLSILRSPWCGLKLDDLLILSQDNTKTIYQQLNNNTQLSKDGSLRAQHLYQALTDAINNIGSFSFSEILTNAIINLAIDKTNDSINTTILNEFLTIINHAETQNKLNIEYITSMLAESFTPSIASNIKIISIHQAKGLEFDTIILVGIGNRKKSDDKELIKLKEFKKHGLLLAIKPQDDSKEKNYNYLDKIAKQNTYFENIRLLYVALTRAKNKIHLLGATNKKNQATNGTPLQLLFPLYSHLWDNIKPITTNNNHKDLKLLRLKNLPAIKPQKIIRTENIMRLNKNTLDASIIGNIIHKIYQLENFNLTKTAIENQLISAGSNNIKKNCNYIIDLLQNNKKSSDFKWVFTPRKYTLTEATFIHNTRNTDLIIIDRLFIDNGKLWIIDFKTAVNSGNNFINQQINQHKDQLNKYKNILQNIYQEPIQIALFLVSISKLIVLK